jgi:hypothetical protein
VQVLQKDAGKALELGKAARARLHADPSTAPGEVQLDRRNESVV